MTFANCGLAKASWQKNEVVPSGKQFGDTEQAFAFYSWEKDYSATLIRLASLWSTV